MSSLTTRLSFDAPSQPANIRIYLIFLESKITDLHFCCWYCRSIFIQFLVGSVKRIFSARVRISCSRSSKVINFGTNRKRVSYFLLVHHSNLGPVSHRFGDIARFLCSCPTPIPPWFWGCSRCTRSPMLGSMWASALSYSAVKLFSKYFNLCENHTSTSQTDGRTDRQTDRRLTVA